MDRVFAVILCIAVIVLAMFALAYCGEAMADDVADVTTVATTEFAVAETTECTEPIPTEEATEPITTLYDVPLDYELQLHIISESVEHDIDPAIIMAMAFKESTYRTDAIGDNGNSYGLLQIQPKWHAKRMKKLGCTDLLDPYQNVTVGVDYLAEQIKRYGGNLAKGLTAYNKGHYAGTVTKYAKTILAHAKKLNNERSWN